MWLWLVAQARAAVPFRLPTGEPAAVWAPALRLADFTATDAATEQGPWVELRPGATRWELVARTRDGELHHAEVAPPHTAREREDVVWLAQSLLAPGLPPFAKTPSGQGGAPVGAETTPTQRAASKPTSRAPRAAPPPPPREGAALPPRPPLTPLVVTETMLAPLAPGDAALRPVPSVDPLVGYLGVSGGVRLRGGVEAGPVMGSAVGVAGEAWRAGVDVAGVASAALALDPAVASGDAYSYRALLEGEIHTRGRLTAGVRLGAGVARYAFVQEQVPVAASWVPVFEGAGAMRWAATPTVALTLDVVAGLDTRGLDLTVNGRDVEGWSPIWVEPRLGLVFTGAPSQNKSSPR